MKIFLKPAVIVAAPFIGMAVGAKTGNPKFGQTTRNITKSISKGKITKLTHMQGIGLRLKILLNFLRYLSSGIEVFLHMI